MQMLILMPVFVLSLIGGQQMFVDAPAHARHVPWHCCSCGMCDNGCYCRYQSPYCGCAVPEDEAIPFQGREAVVDIRTAREPRAFTIAQWNLSGRLQTLITMKNDRKHFALKVLDGFENGLKIWCPGSDERLRSDIAVALHMHDHAEE